METFDHIILGTGQATGTLLGRLIPTGERIVVIEGAHVGGSCVNYGCTPTKTLVASARAAHVARRGPFYGVETGPVRIDYARVRARMNEVRHGSRDGLTRWMEETPNVTLIRGWGRFEEPRTLRVGERRLRGGQIYINVGMRPAVPPIDGLDAVPWLDSARLLDLETRPDHLVIVGGGYIGMEFAQIYRRFGAEVTVVQRAPQVMPREDADVAAEIRRILEGEGVRILCDATAERVDGQQGAIRVTVRHGEGTETLVGTHLLVAAGRCPNSDRLNLEAAGIETDDRGFIRVDDVCRTNVEGVFALGDVNGHGAFTHTAVNDAEIVLDHLFGGTRRLSQRIPIYALFTDPPLGRVGMSEREALASGKRVLKATRPMSRISRAKEMGETQGFAKLLVDADTDRILGAAILGPNGDEIVNMFAAIMHSDIPCRRYREVVLVHPTVSELMPWILDDLEEVEPAEA
ncbi:mercuric reductase [Rhodocaloribacter litoris]|uniref:mercuric reductase n=1 Tax=Rhodocaloribacter litoris TaxID=2558931 RepID=UPI00141DC654|nr:mercuric reductase [Rhodocaloribacter litoris]QXD14287.1 mercuric reductase [Rhodocaloribacter litoris]